MLIIFHYKTRVDLNFGIQVDLAWVLNLTRPCEVLFLFNQPSPALLRRAMRPINLSWILRAHFFTIKHDKNANVASKSILLSSRLHYKTRIKRAFCFDADGTWFRSFLPKQEEDAHFASKPVMHSSCYRPQFLVFRSAKRIFHSIPRMGYFRYYWLRAARFFATGHELKVNFAPRPKLCSACLCSLFHYSTRIKRSFRFQACHVCILHPLAFYPKTRLKTFFLFQSTICVHFVGACYFTTEHD